uniref:Restriction endonuclease subunit S n=1 Tax=candidate division WOR-3 bacterium TaxID=2052148 RepID=A0A7C4CBF7_UNCW3
MKTSTWKESLLADLILPPEPGSRPPGGAHCDSGDVPSIGGENIDTAGRMILSGLKLIPRFFYMHMPRGHLRPLDVLINKDGAQTGKVAMYRGEYAESAVNEHVFILRGRHSVLLQPYLFYCLLFDSAQVQISRAISGSAQPGLNSRFVHLVKVKYPVDLAEQRRIAEILDTVDEVIQKTEQVIDKLKMIKQGLLHDLLTRGIDDNGKLREVVEPQPLQPISAMAEINPPQTVSVESPDAWVSFVPMADVSDQGCWEANQVRLYKEVCRGFTAFQEGDVLFAKITPCMENSKGFLAQNLMNGIGFGSTEFHVLRARLGNSQRYLAHLLRSPRLRKRAEAFMIGSAGQQRVQAGFFECYETRFVTHDEQERIADVLDAHDARIRAEEAYRDKLKMLKQGLMHDLLTGKVRVKVA